MARRILPHPGYLVASLFVTVILAVPVSYVLTPPLVRWYMLADLDSDDASARERSLQYIRYYAPDDPSIVLSARPYLKVQSDAHFLQTAHAIDLAGHWRRERVGTDAWLRWLGLLAADADPTARIMGAQELARLTDLNSDQRVLRLFDTLLDDADTDVRYNALTAAGEYAVSMAEPASLLDRIAARTADPQPIVARQAWLLLGLLGVPQHVTADADAIAGVSPIVGQAMVWALARQDRLDEATVAALVHDPSAHALVRGMAAYTSASRHPAVAAAVRAMFAAAPDATLDADALIVLWRAIEGMPLDAASDEDTALAVGLIDALMAGAHDRIALAAIDRYPFAFTLWRDASDTRWTALLAALEGTPVGQASLQITDDMPDLLRLAAVRVMDQPRPYDLTPVFYSDSATLRELACIVAADRFTTEQHEQLVNSLLTDFDDEARMSGAILAGLTGVQRELLARVTAAHRQMEHETKWRILQVLQLGMWMQGRPVQGRDGALDMNRHVLGLLGRADMPRTTVLLAMLHTGHPQALQRLLQPRTDERPLFADLPAERPLAHLFEHYRWWWVLKRYLPDDAPGFALWADDDLQQLQVDALRNWLLTRGQTAAR